jgi:hypothetical protein
MDGAAVVLQAGRELLDTHVGSAPDGTPIHRTEWAPALVSPGVRRALLAEVAGLARGWPPPATGSRPRPAGAARPGCAACYARPVTVCGPWRSSSRPPGNTNRSRQRYASCCAPSRVARFRSAACRAQATTSQACARALSSPRSASAGAPGAPRPRRPRSSPMTRCATPPMPARSPATTASCCCARPPTAPQRTSRHRTLARRSPAPQTLPGAPAPAGWSSRACYGASPSRLPTTPPSRQAKPATWPYGPAA